jgi:hypothetical protein
MRWPDGLAEFLLNGRYCQWRYVPLLNSKSAALAPNSSFATTPSSGIWRTFIQRRVSQCARPTDHPEVMPVQIDQEGSEIIGGVLRSVPRRAVVAPTLGEAYRVKAPHRFPIGSGEAHVKSVARSDGPRPVVRCVYHEELRGRGAVANEIGLLKAPHRADRRQQRVVERPRAREIRNTYGKMIDERHLTETQVGNRRSRRFIVGRHRPKSETMCLVGIGIWGVSVMSVKLYAFTCGWLTGEFGRLMEGGEGDITVPIPVS